MDRIIDESSAPMSVLLVEDDDGDAVLVTELLEDAVPGTESTGPGRGRAIGELADDARPSTASCSTSASPTPTDSTRCARVSVGRRRASPSSCSPASTTRPPGSQRSPPARRTTCVKGAGRRRRADAGGALRDRARARGGGRRQLLGRRSSGPRRTPRLERGLLPQPVLDRPGIPSRPGTARRASAALLGGDFYDVDRAPDGTCTSHRRRLRPRPRRGRARRSLRIAWRTLVLAGAAGDRALPTLSSLLVHERDRTELFATLCNCDHRPRLQSARPAARRPPGRPSSCRPDGAARPLPTTRPGRPIGLVADDRWAGPRRRAARPVGAPALHRRPDRGPRRPRSPPSA